MEKNRKMKTNKSKKRVKKIKVKQILLIMLLFTFFMMLRNTSKNIDTNKISRRFFKSNSIVKNADIKVVDGTGPFDENNNPGNDTDNSNYIVRANDNLIYNIQPFTELIDKTKKEYGNIIVEGKLPKQRLIFWDQDAMKKWAADAISFSEDTNNYYFKFQKDYKELLGDETGGASVNFPFKVLVSGAKNGTKINPEFEIYMEGNKDGQKFKLKPEEVMVSSEPRYKIDLKNYSNDRYVSLNYKEKEGIVSSYVVTLQLQNPEDKKGLKGIEFPQGDFLGDLSFKSTFSSAEHNLNLPKKDITEEYTPELYQYQLNASRKDTQKIEENRKDIVNIYTGQYPYVWDNRRENFVFRNKDGEFTAADLNIIEKEKNDYLLKFSDYKLDERNTFPYVGESSAPGKIKEQTGFLSVGIISVFTPMPDEAWIENYLKEQNNPVKFEEFDYRVELETFIKNPRFINFENEEQRISDDLRTLFINVKYTNGGYESFIVSYTKEMARLTPQNGSWTAGTAKILKGKEFSVISFFSANAKIPEDKLPKGITQITKFDAEKVKIVKAMPYDARWPIDKIYYGIKKDGKDWTSDQEMNKAIYSDLNFFETVEEAEKYGKIVAVASQAKSDGVIFKADEGNYRYRFRTNFITTDEAKEGDVAQFVSDGYYFFDSTDGGDLLKGEFNPPAEGKGISMLKHEYIKTAYDENGQMIPGTHAPKEAYSGNSVLILEAVPKIEIETDKNTYNVTAEETKINVKLKPILDLVDDIAGEEKKVSIITTIPKDVAYVPDTAFLKGIPIKTLNIEKDEAGNTKLTFEFDSKINKAEFESNIIDFKVKIPTSFGESREIKFNTVISAEDLAKAAISDRTSEKGVYIVNILAQIANKSLKQDVIEYGERFEYSIKFMNQSPMKYTDVTMLDILPHNGDKFGTKFNGKYYIENMKSNIGAKIYYTKDEKIREYNAKNLSEANVKWIEYKSGEKLEGVTAIYSISDVKEKSMHDITYDIVPENAKGGDFYANRLLTYVKGQADTLDTPIYKGAVAKRSITGLVWEDKNINGVIESAEKKLGNITVKLRTEQDEKVTRIDGTIVEDTITNVNGLYKFEDVPPAKNLVLSIVMPDGKEITKKIKDNKAGLDGKIKNIAMKSAKEMFVSNYSEELANQNFGLIPKLNITGTKEWTGGKDRPGISLQLYRSIESKEKIAVGEAVVLNTENVKNKTSYTWKNQDVADNEGNLYTYSVDELNVPENYTKEISKDGLTIINKYNSPRITITGKKIWEGGIDRPDITITLYRTANGKKEIVEENIKLTQSGANEYTFTREVDKTDKDGNEYVYEIDEKKVPTNFVKSKINNMTIKNTYVSPKTSVTVNKIWQGGNVRPQISAQLYRNGEKYLEPVALNTENGNAISYTWNNLDKTDKNGSEYVYTVDEVNVPENFVKSINEKGREIVNTYVSPKIDVKATKKWVGGENVRPKKIKLGLYRTLDNVSKEKVSEAEIEITKGAVTEYVWKMLDKTDGLGNEYTYTVSELEVPENYNKEETGLVVVNTYVSPKIDVPVTKTFVNGSSKRQAIELQLLRNGAYLDKVVFNPVAGQDNYKHIFKDLDKTDSTGKNYEYSVKEVTNLENFVKKETGLAVTNEYVIPKTSVSFKKIWNGGFIGKAKPTFEVQLLRDGEPFLDKVVIEDGTVEHTWSGLDRTDINGKEYNYEIKEILVPKYYDSKIEKVADGNFEITNTFVMPKINIFGNKIWNFGPEEKPEIDVVLLANGKEVDSITLKNEETSFEFKDKDIFDENGEVIEYKVEEEVHYKDYINKQNIKYDFKYNSEITQTEVSDVEKNREFKIENTYIIPKKEITVKKIWKGINKNKAPNVTIGLFKDGEKIDEVVLKSGETMHTFTDLDVTDSYGKEYKYTVDELNVPEGYMKSISGYNITNTKENTRDYPFAGLSKNTLLYTAIAITSLYLVYNYKNAKKPIKKKSRYKIVNKESLKK